MLATVFLTCALAQANPVEPEAPAPSRPVAQSVPLSPSPAPPILHLPRGSELRVELTEALSSNVNHLGDHFPIRLAEPIARDGVAVVRAGAVGEGEVIDVAPAGMMGKQGKLIISARYLDLNGQRVRVRGMTLMASGTSHVDLATGLLIIPFGAPAAIFVKGGEILIPSTTQAIVRLAEDVDLPIAASTEATGKIE